MPILLILTGCFGSSDNVDQFFGGGNGGGTTPVVVPPTSDLSISITNPSLNGTSAGYEISLSGSCGTVGKTIEIYGDTETFSVCNVGNVWTATLDLQGVPTGTVTINARMRDDVAGETGTPATRTLNKITSACDSPAARADTFANFTVGGGDGGAVPWIICTPLQLQNLNGYLSDNAELGSDIDFQGGSFSGIGGTYSGTFEGNNLTISNFMMTSTGSTFGLFRQVNGVTVIRNLIVDGATINIGGYRAGVVVGYALQNTDLTLTNVHVRNSSITTGHASNGEAGGILGRSRDLASTTTISNCSATNVDITSQNNSGGLVGYIQGSAIAVNITNSYVNGGTISGRQNVGGFVGAITQDGAVVSNCHSTADVTGSSGNIGGFAGQLRGIITDVYATGDVNRTGGNQVGGLIGHFRQGASSLTGTAPAATRPGGISSAPPQTCFASGAVNGGTAQYVGGLIGRNDTNTVQSCYATGNVTGGNAYVGGLLGYSQGDFLDDSFATGAVLGSENYVGGLIGYVTNASQSITASYALGNVSTTGLSPEYIGGLVGRFRATDRAEDVFAEGNITAVDGDGSADIEYIGGLIGWAEIGNSDIINAYATGNVTVSTAAAPGNYRYIGGLIGYSSHFITNSYATGAVTANEAQYVGGLIGYQNQRSITNSRAFGDVTGATRIGGLAGGTNSGTTITSCFATGYTVGLTGGYVGGLTGFGRAHIFNSYAVGDVTGNGNYIGGLDGGHTQNNRLIQNCFASGNVDGGTAQYVGGLVGYLRTTTDNFTDNFAFNTVRGGQDVGGIVGRLRRNNVNAMRRSYHIGTIVRALGAPGAEGTFGPLAGTIQGGASGLEAGTNFYSSNYQLVNEGGGVLATPNLANQTPLTNLQMQVPGNFTSYDFILPVWEIPSIGYRLPNTTIVYPYPILDWMN